MSFEWEPCISVISRCLIVEDLLFSADEYYVCRAKVFTAGCTRHG